MLPESARRHGYPDRLPDRPIHLDWHAAPDALLARTRLAPGPTVCCIAGPVGSGKSTLAARLNIAGAVLLSTDDYLPDYDATPDHLRDEPGSAHLDELALHISELLAGRAAETPVWSFHEHRRTGVRQVHPAGLIVVEGIHALHARLDPVRTLGVFVDASPATRWARWEILESTGQRGWGVEKARAFFESVADPTFDRHRPDYLDRADYLVVNDHGLPPR
ncbi:MAG: hypothetical protein D6692_02765 [Planctomycetota bacterium]|nr:MAG: hypothetical protein D6692_02765 [Planctomycetota bacterium]